VLFHGKKIDQRRRERRDTKCLIGRSQTNWRLIVHAKEGGNEAQLWNGLTKFQSDQRISCLTYA
jgi:hypothetical protein